jgi:hypothetical protein
LRWRAWLDGRTDGNLPEWSADHDIVRELEVEASRLRHSATRLAALRGRVVADLAAQDAAELDANSGS